MPVRCKVVPGRKYDIAITDEDGNIKRVTAVGGDKVDVSMHAYQGCAGALVLLDDGGEAVENADKTEPVTLVEEPSILPSEDSAEALPNGEEEESDPVTAPDSDETASE